MTDARTVYGVTGLPCAGKSCAARLLASGAVTGTAGELIKADDLGHRVLERFDVREKLAKRLGADTLAGDAAETRRRIAARVFTDAAALSWLEELVHPLVREEARRIVAGLPATRPAVVEAALLLAADMDRDCDRVLLVEATPAARLTRAAARGWSGEELARRDRRLLPLFAPERLRAVGGKLIRIANNADDDLLGERLAAALALAGIK